MSSGIIDNLVNQLTKLPGIGQKTAQRLAFHILTMPEDEAKAISNAIVYTKDNAIFCPQCFNITDINPCYICRDTMRQSDMICVVEDPSNIMAIERTRWFKGKYHVLCGALSPIDGITPDKLKIKELLERVKNNNIEEVIIATNPNSKGDITSQYIAELLKPLSIKVSRIAYGLPIGGDIEFADEVTLIKSFEGRRQL